MNIIENKTKITQAIEKNDIESALSLSIDGYLHSDEMNDGNRVVFLRLIRGFAEKIIEKIHKIENTGINYQPKCDYCDRKLNNSELIRGHSGTICIYCIDIMYKDINR